MEKLRAAHAVMKRKVGSPADYKQSPRRCQIGGGALLQSAARYDGPDGLDAAAADADDFFM